MLEGLLAEVAKYGTASVKRVYADWTVEQNRWVYLSNCVSSRDCSFHTVQFRRISMTTSARANLYVRTQPRCCVVFIHLECFGPHMFRPWKSMLLAHAVQPIQQFAYASGKNATGESKPA